MSYVFKKQYLDVYDDYIENEGKITEKKLFDAGEKISVALIGLDNVERMVLLTNLLIQLEDRAIEIEFVEE
jgi:hypothetical protein